MDDQALLRELFTAVLAASEGEEAVALHERAAALGKRGRAGDLAAARELEELVSALSLEDAQVLMRSLSRWFQLMNLAEDNERVRRLRRRERGLGDTPRAGSLRAAVTHLAERGVSAGELRGDARGRRAPARHDRPPDRGAAPDHGREARAHLRAAARSG